MSFYISFNKFRYLVIYMASLLPPSIPPPLAPTTYPLLPSHPLPGHFALSAPP